LKKYQIKLARKSQI